MERGVGPPSCRSAKAGRARAGPRAGVAAHGTAYPPCRAARGPSATVSDRARARAAGQMEIYTSNYVGSFSSSMYTIMTLNIHLYKHIDI